jgi:transcriptional regulator with XRE-family HTH domain
VIESGEGMPTNSVGERIALYRKRAKMNQQSLAVACGVALSQVSRWERDQSQPSLDSLRILSRVLGVSIDILVGKE